jgi:hypothetical protein
MTRINVIPVSELNVKMLVSEYREITRLPSNLRTSLSRKTKPFSLSEIPQKYTLGTGHVKFFYDKMQFLKNRFEQLVLEMQSRGYTTNYTDSSIFDFEPKYMNNYTPTNEAMEINRERIAKRISESNYK